MGRALSSQICDKNDKDLKEWWLVNIALMDNGEKYGR